MAYIGAQEKRLLEEILSYNSIQDLMQLAILDSVPYCMKKILLHLRKLFAKFHSQYCEFIENFSNELDKSNQLQEILKEKIKQQRGFNHKKWQDILKDLLQQHKNKYGQRYVQTSQRSRMTSILSNKKYQKEIMHEGGEQQFHTKQGKTQAEQQKQAYHEELQALKNQNLKLKRAYEEQKKPNFVQLYRLFKEKQYQLQKAKQTISSFQSDRSIEYNSCIQMPRFSELLDSSVWKTPPQATYIRKEVEFFSKKVIKSSKILYRYDEKNLTNFHSYIDNYENILLVVELLNGRFICAFSSAPFQPENELPQDSLGLLMSLSQERCFPVKNGGKAIAYKHCFLTFGLNELQIPLRSNIIQSRFGEEIGEYQTHGYTNPSVLFGEEKEEIQMSAYEIHHLIF